MSSNDLAALIELKKLGRMSLIDECRRQRELLDAQSGIIRQLSDSLSKMCVTANALGDTLQALVNSHNSGDQQAIAEMLELMSARAKSFKRPEEH